VKPANFRWILRVVYAAEVAQIHEAEHGVAAAAESQPDATMGSARAAWKQEELAVEPEMDHEPAAIQLKEKIFRPALHAADGPASDGTRESSRCLRPDGDGMHDANTCDARARDQRLERAADSFDFRKFGH